MWGKCEKPESGKNVKNSRGKILEKMWKKIGVEKAWINDLEEVKSVEKCQCGKKRDKFPWENITYLVVALPIFIVIEYGHYFTPATISYVGISIVRRCNEESRSELTTWGQLTTVLK